MPRQILDIGRGVDLTKYQRKCSLQTIGDDMTERREVMATERAGEVDPTTSRTGAVSRRIFVQTAAIAGAATIATRSMSAESALSSGSGAAQAALGSAGPASNEIVKEKIRRAMLAGPESITAEATVAEMDLSGKMTVLRKGSNKWVCIPGLYDVVGFPDMCVDPQGMLWLMDYVASKPKPSNTSPGLIYMLNGATQRSYTDPFDRTSPAFEVGPHWMIIWPFDATEAGLSTVMRDAGTLVMFAGTPYAHLHICGSPWDGKELHPGDKGVWTMTYARP
jgi:hypothetical protein